PPGEPGRDCAGRSQSASLSPGARVHSHWQADPAAGRPRRHRGDHRLHPRPEEHRRGDGKGNRAAPGERADRHAVAADHARTAPEGHHRPARPRGLRPELPPLGETPLPPLRDVIARHGLAARHSLGQHFLLDGNLTDRIVREAGDLAGRHVIEVGPGPGGLTRSLLGSAAASVTAIELDRRAGGPATELAETTGGRLRVIEADALSIDTASLVPAPRQIIANLPYNVASPLLVGWLRQAASFERLTLMFQQEVAERICAERDTPAYGRPSILT